MSASDTQDPGRHVHRQHLDAVVIRFAGDSGDGMQVTGSQFTATSALFGNDLATLPDFPAEIRAPAGTISGVSGFQIQIGSHEIFTPGDQPHTLVAMNPAALKVNLRDLDPGATVIVNTDAFDAKDLEKAGFAANPLEDGSLNAFRVITVPLTSMTHTALESTDLSKRDKDRCKNFFALGLVYWLYDRPLEHTLGWIEDKFAKTPQLQEANAIALKAGWNFGETTELFDTRYDVAPARDARPGRYRRITGNEAAALGFVTAAHLAGIDLFLGSYPITPASDVLHALSRYKHYNVRTFQAEDEIAAVCAAIGAAWGGALGLTTTSGPGVALKTEAIGLAFMVELPLIIANIQRGGPSTGLPTKTEQSDLFQAVFGRNGDAPIPVIAASTPSDCFDAAIEAARIATRYMTPVFFLSDGYIANGAEPWRIPDPKDLPDLKVTFRTDPEGFAPYLRDEQTLARPWVVPGTPGMEHRIGGLEKQHITGDVSYDPLNHELMTRLRAEKVDRIARDIPDAEIFGPEEGDLLIVGWGGTWGAIHTAVAQAQHDGLSVAHLHIRHLHPLPLNVGPALQRYKRVVVAERNNGQLRTLLRARFLVDVEGLNKIQGKPFKVAEILKRIHDAIQEPSNP